MVDRRPPGADRGGPDRPRSPRPFGPTDRRGARSARPVADRPASSGVPAACDGGQAVGFEQHPVIVEVDREGTGVLADRHLPVVGARVLGDGPPVDPPGHLDAGQIRDGGEEVDRCGVGVVDHGPPLAWPFDEQWRPGDLGLVLRGERSQQRSRFEADPVICGHHHDGVVPSVELGEPVEDGTEQAIGPLELQAMADQAGLAQLVTQIVIGPTGELRSKGRVGPVVGVP